MWSPWHAHLELLIEAQTSMIQAWASADIKQWRSSRRLLDDRLHKMEEDLLNEASNRAQRRTSNWRERLTD